MSRHKWIKLRLHVYICRQCGTGKVNAENGPGNWEATYHQPDGTSAVYAHVPPCAAGRLTERYLAKYAPDIAAADREKKEKKDAEKGLTPSSM